MLSGLGRSREDQGEQQLQACGEKDVSGGRVS